MALTAKQERFVAEYLIDLNATQAATRAGYSAKTAHSVGHENLKKPEIAHAIQEAKAKRSDRTEITQDRVLQELARIGFADIRKAVAWGSAPDGAIDDEGSPAQYPVELKPSTEVDDETAAAISEVALTQNGVKLKMHDKLSALDKLARHLGILNGSGAGEDDAPSLTININAKDPVGDVRVTRSDS
jgi:phage terminase small subunit